MQTTENTGSGVAPLYAGITHGCDTHAHMIGDDADFPLAPKRAENPPSGGLEHWLGVYAAHLASLGLTRGVIVHSILYGLDNAVTAEAVRRLGRENFRAIGLVSKDVSEAELDRLADQGFVGVRMNYVHGGVLDWDGAKRLAPRLKARGMHLQMLLHTHQHMVELAPELARFPTDVVIDHCGWPDVSQGPEQPGFQALLTLLHGGSVWLKLSGVFRFCRYPYTNADRFVERAVAANPERLLWGSDWPYLMLGDATRPDVANLAAAFLRVVPEQHRQTILADNPQRLFGF